MAFSFWLLLKCFHWLWCFAGLNLCLSQWIVFINSAQDSLFVKIKNICVLLALKILNHDFPYHFLLKYILRMLSPSRPIRNTLHPLSLHSLNFSRYIFHLFRYFILYNCLIYTSIWLILNYLIFFLILNCDSFYLCKVCCCCYCCC